MPISHKLWMLRHIPAFCLSRCRPAGGRLSAGEVAPSDKAQEMQALNVRLIGQPSNHNYQLTPEGMVPSFWLFIREREVRRLYPTPVTSLLDIGCCRGYYVFRAASHPECKSAVGIDVDQGSIAVCGDVRQHIGAVKTAFHLATLEEVSGDPSRFGGPFQTVLLLGTYHYLFWGSHRSSICYTDHDRIMSMLKRVCRDRIILSGRLDVKHLPKYLRQKASNHPARESYTTKSFLEAARRHFSVRRMGRLERYPAYVLTPLGR